MFDTKIVVVLRDDLAPWQRANVTAFLISGIAAGSGVVGEAYVDATGRNHLPMLRQPVFVFEGAHSDMKRVYDRTISREVVSSIFSDAIFATNNDGDNRAAVRAIDAGASPLAGIAFRAPAKIADKITGGLSRHR